MALPWTKTRPVDRYDLVVVGGDALGVLVAERARAAGRRVALASDHPLALDATAEAARRTLFQAAEIGLRVAAARRLGWPRAAAGEFDFGHWRQTARQLADAARERFAAERLQALGIDVRLGPMTFQSPDSLRVAGESLAFARAVLAPPARWALPEIPGLAQLDCLTPDGLDRLTDWPRRWAIVGGAELECQLAQSLAQLGATVDLITADDRLLANTPLDIALTDDLTGPTASGPRRPSALVARRLSDLGVRIWTRCAVVEAARTGAAKSLLVDYQGGPQKILADEILVGARRWFDLEWLRLDTAGVAVEPGDIKTDAGLRTSNRRIVAAPASRLPDVADEAALAALANLAAETALGSRPRPASSLVAPRRLRFDPPIAWIGDPPSGDSVERVSLSRQELAWSGALAGPHDARVLEIASGEHPPRGAEPSETGADDGRVDASCAADPGEPNELWLAFDRQSQLCGAIVIGLQAQRLEGAMRRRIDARATGAAPPAMDAEWLWLARVLDGRGARSGRLERWLRRWRRSGPGG